MKLFELEKLHNQLRKATTQNTSNYLVHWLTLQTNEMYVYTDILTTVHGTVRVSVYEKWKRSLELGVHEKYEN